MPSSVILKVANTLKKPIPEIEAIWDDAKNDVSQVGNYALITQVFKKKLMAKYGDGVLKKLGWPKPVIAEEQKTHFTTKGAWLNAADSYGYTVVFQRDKEQIIAYKGSVDVGYWYDNVHQGFLIAPGAKKTDTKSRLAALKARLKL